MLRCAFPVSDFDRRLHRVGRAADRARVLAADIGVMHRAVGTRRNEHAATTDRRTGIRRRGVYAGGVLGMKLARAGVRLAEGSGLSVMIGAVFGVGSFRHFMPICGPVAVRIGAMWIGLVFENFFAVRQFVIIAVGVYWISVVLLHLDSVFQSVVVGVSVVRICAEFRLLGVRKTIRVAIQHGRVRTPLFTARDRKKPGGNEQEADEQIGTDASHEKPPDTWVAPFGRP